MFVLEMLILAGLPLLFASGATYVTWGALARPLVFLLASTAVLYLVYAGSMWLWGPAQVGYTLSVQQPGETQTSEPLFLVLPPFKFPLMMFVGAAVPVLAVLLRAFRRK